MSADNYHVPGIRYKDDTLQPYCVAKPKTEYEQYLWQLAHALGRPINTKYAALMEFLRPQLTRIAQRVHGDRR